MFHIETRFLEKLVACFLHTTPNQYLWFGDKSLRAATFCTQRKGNCVQRVLVRRRAERVKY